MNFLPKLFLSSLFILIISASTVFAAKINIVNNSNKTINASIDSIHGDVEKFANNIQPGSTASIIIEGRIRSPELNFLAKSVDNPKNFGTISIDSQEVLSKELNLIITDDNGKLKVNIE